MKWKFIWASEDYEVRGTNDPALAKEISEFEAIIDTERGVILCGWPDAPAAEVEIPQIDPAVFKETP